MFKMSKFGLGLTLSKEPGWTSQTRVGCRVGGGENDSNYPHWGRACNGTGLSHWWPGCSALESRKAEAGRWKVI